MYPIAPRSASTSLLVVSRRALSLDSGNLIRVGGKVCEELRKRMIDVCCLQEVRWGGVGSRMLGMKGRKCKLWCSLNGDGVGGVGVMVKEELCEKVLGVRIVSDDCCCF